SAWHTRLMEDGVQAMRDYLAGLDIASPEHQVLMNVTAKSEVAPSIIKENLSLHLTHTVKWTESLDTFLNMPTPVAFLEISNKPYLGNMLNDFAGVVQQRVMHCRKAFSDAKVFK
ncbi:ACP S-malonyltransferase, partial [Escherichia coli]|nr:ACP S-malonyltransferase [Escherichia coli]MCN9105962.1 ACP S-malonyltransferase [Escherichia coli]